MKHPDMHTFTSAFENVKHIHITVHKATLREIVIAESLHKHAEYQEKRSILSFYSSCIQFMKNVKLTSATIAVVAISTVASIFAPSVMAQVAVSNGLDYLAEFSVAELETSGYIFSDINFEESLTEAKNANDLKIIPENNAIAEFSVAELETSVYTISDINLEDSLTGTKNANDLKIIPENNAIAEFSNESDMNMVMGKSTSPNEPGYVESSKVEMIGNGTMEDPSRPKYGVIPAYQSELQVTKYLQYTNPAGKKVTLGIDKNNLPIIMKVSR